MKVRVLIFFGLIVSNICWGQTYNQHIRGKISDQFTGEPLVGATIQAVDTEFGVITDTNGEFDLELPTGRYQIVISFVGFEPQVYPEVLLTSSKELLLNVALKYAPTELDEIVVRAESKIQEIGKREITIEQTQRYAATFYDPARLVESIPAANNVNDQNNNISVRGVSPAWNQWYLEGVEIANPNHTSNAGTISDQPTQNGGGVNMLSAQMLATSSFLYQNYGTSYGNALGGIFDMKLRTGNNSRREHTAQASFIGFDIATEGPLGKSKASYLVNYRYSFTGLLANMGVDFGGEEIYFQDFAANLNFPYKNGNLKVFGMVGSSDNRFQAPESIDDVEEGKELYDIRYLGNILIVGASNQTNFGDGLSMDVALVYSSNESDRNQYRIHQLDINDTIVNRTNALNIAKLSGKVGLDYQFSKKAEISVGSNLTYYSFDVLRFIDYTTTLDHTFFLDEQVVFSPYAKLNWSALPSLTFDLGLRYAYHTASKDGVLQPRFAANYWLNETNRLSASAGSFSQINTPAVQFNIDSPDNNLVNSNLPQIQSNNFSVGYSRFFSQKTLDTEIFYNAYSEIPIVEAPFFTGTTNSTNLYSAFNTLNTVPEEVFAPLGNARVYGIQASMEQRLSGSWYYLVGGSFYQSEFEGKDGQYYDAQWNGQYAFNGTIGREFIRKSKKNKQRTFGVNARILYQGGFKERPVDISSSESSKNTTFDLTQPFTFTAPDYFRVDLRLVWRVEKQKYSRTLSLDLQNATNYENFAFSFYDEFTDSIEVQNQLGLIPMLTYRVEF